MVYQEVDPNNWQPILKKIIKVKTTEGITELARHRYYSEIQ